jgi:hypothetical protein
MPEFKVDGIADHPNQWFRASITYHKLKQQALIPVTASAPNGSSVSVIVDAVSATVDEEVRASMEVA